jgi:hypothetical protein
MNPQKDCNIITEDHAEERRIQRGLTRVDLEKVVREGNWEHRSDGCVDVVSGKWTVRIEIGKCNLGVLTVFK